MGSAKRIVGWAKQPRIWLAVLALVATAAVVEHNLSSGSPPFKSWVYPDTYEYVDAAWQLDHGRGYLTYVRDLGNTVSPTHIFGTKLVPPRYPFGTSVAIAPFEAVFGYRHGAELGAQIVVIAYVLALVATAWLIGGPLAAVIAAVFLRTSPFVWVMSQFVLSDPLAALLSVLILIALIRRSKLSLILAGVAAGALIDVRLTGALGLVAAFIAAPRKGRWLVLGASLPFIVLVGYQQWHEFGSPFKTGYGYYLPHLNEFSARYIDGAPFGADGLFPRPHLADLFLKACGCDIKTGGLRNILFYPAVLSGLLWVYAPPLAGIIGLVALIYWRRTPPARYALILVVLNLAVLLVYSGQGSRLIAPAASMLTIYSAAGIASVLGSAYFRFAPRSFVAHPQPQGEGEHAARR